MAKALISIVVAVAVWGRFSFGDTIMHRCDNQAVVLVIHSRTSKNHIIMHMLRCLAFFEASFTCHVLAEHIPGALNELADNFSRNNLHSFLQKAPGMAQHPCNVPQLLRDLLFRSVN